MGTTRINQQYYLFLLDMSFYLESLRGDNSYQCITRYGQIHFLFLWGFFLVYILQILYKSTSEIYVENLTVD